MQKKISHMMDGRNNDMAIRSDSSHVYIYCHNSWINGKANMLLARDFRTFKLSIWTSHLSLFLSLPSSLSPPPPSCLSPSLSLSLSLPVCRPLPLLASSFLHPLIPVSIWSNRRQEHRSSIKSSKYSHIDKVATSGCNLIYIQSIAPEYSGI